MEFQALLAGKETIDDQELNDRFEHRSSGGYTHHYLVRDQGKAVAFVSLDFYPLDQHFVIYQIFVQSSMRKRGFGSRIIKIVENLAKSQGYKRIVLWARPLDALTKQETLISWYRRHGYQDDPRQEGMMFKVLE